MTTLLDAGRTSPRRITRWVRQHAPDPLVRALRSTVRGWGWLTAPWRLTPSFIVVGAQRAGTTSLYRVLSQHPCVVRPVQSKGVGYFDLGSEHSLRWYRAHFPLAGLARRRTRGRPQAFESSGYYLFHPAAARRMAAALPDVRVVVVVRDPVERAYSAHRHELARGFEDRCFEEALLLEQERLRGEGERLCADPRYSSYHHRHHGYLARSRYSEQVRRYVDALGAERVHIVDADRFFADPDAELGPLLRWLGLPPWRPMAVERWNAREREPLDPALRADLESYFEPCDNELAALMGRRPSWRGSQP